MARRMLLVVAKLIGPAILLTVVVCGSTAAQWEVKHVEASDGLYAGMVRVTWDAVSAAIGYEVQRREPPATQWKTIDNPTSAHLWDHVTSCVVYEYRVRAWNYRGTTDFSDLDDGYANGAPPSSPSNAYASIDRADQIELAWSSSDGAVGYQVFAADSQDGQFVLIATPTSTTWIDAALQPCSERWYQVAACGVCGCSTPSAPVHGLCTGPLAAAPNPSQTSSSTVGEARVLWDAVPGAAYYTVERFSKQMGYSADWVPSGTTSDTSISLPSPLAPACGAYDWVRVHACNCAGACSVPGEVKLDWTSTYMPVPQNLTATLATVANGAPGVRLDWAPVTGADRYEVWSSKYYPDVVNLNPRAVVNTPTLLTENSYECETSYWVRACRGNSPDCSICGPCASVEVEQGRVAAQVMNLQASKGTLPGRTLLSWNPCPGATHYEVLRGTPGMQDQVEVAWVPGYETSYWADNSAPSCQTYSYTVRGCNTCGCGSDSEPALGYVGAPMAPSVWVESSWTEDGQPAVVSWYLDMDANRYLVSRADASDGAEEVIADLALPWAGVNGQQGSIVDPPPTGPCAKYYYRVAACYDCACTWSDSMLANFGKTVVATPSGLGAQLADDGSVVVTWNPVPGAVAYRVHILGPGCGGGEVVEAFAPPLKYAIPSFLQSCTHFAIQIQSVTTCDFSQWSQYVGLDLP